MVLNFLSSSPRGLSLEDVLKLANEQLKNARKSNEPAKKLKLCKDAKSKIKDAEKIFAAKCVDIASAYHEHAKLLDELGYHDKAQESHGKVKDWGQVQQVSQQAASFNNAGLIHQYLCPPSAFTATPIIVSLMNHNNLNLDIADPVSQNHSQKANPGTKDCILEPKVNTLQSPLIFHEDVVLPIARYTLPEDIRRITSTPQLAYCLSLSLPSLVSKEGLNEIELEWSQVRVNDPDGQKRLKSIATDLIRTFIRDDLKKSDVVAEVVSLTAVLDQEDFRELLRALVDGIEQSVLLKVHLLNGLAHLIRNAAPGYIDVDDLVKILELLNKRLKETHQQSTQHIYRLTMTVSRVLDSMVDSQVKDLKREQLHEPLLEYLKDLQDSSDPYMIYQAAYAYQALQYIPDDETILQAALRRTGKVVQGISGVVSAMKAIDLNGFIDGLKDIQRGLKGASDAVYLANKAYINAVDLSDSGQNLLEYLKAGFSFNRKSAWYPALRALDILIQEGQLAEFEKLIRGAPCRQDPAFQWGVCQRLGEIAANTLWDSDIRQCATSFLGELYRDNTIWIQQDIIKTLIHCIFSELTGSSNVIVADHARGQLQELEAKQLLSQDNTSSYPIAVTLPPQASPLLDRVLNKLDIEANLIQLRKERLKERNSDVYISPRAKASQKAIEDFDLTSKVHEFLESNKKVLLLLGDSGAGKSTFNKALEASLWENYEKNNGRIPLSIHLPAIDKPEQDLIAKQLLKANFTEHEIRELKANHEFILICDGYDESQQTQNLYMSNQLNQTGGWRAQMVISCRTEYNGIDYEDLFQPIDRNNRSLGLMQEANIVPFNKGQIQDYIEQYVSLRKPPWESKDYIRALKEIQNLEDLVKNPFLLKLALEVLPTLVNRESGFAHTRVTRLELYDEFVAQWIQRNKIRIGGMDLSPQNKETFKILSDSGFKRHGITYLKELATAIYDNQGGNPVVEYSEHDDQKTWKEAIFNKRDGKNLLQEAIPLVRNGDQYRFIHKSILEYGLALAVYDPKLRKEEAEPRSAPSRRGSASSILSFETPIPNEGAATAIYQSLLDSPLGRRSFVHDPSILQFLVERVQQQPVFKEQLQATIQFSKLDEAARIAAANSITVLVQAGVTFNGTDLRGIRIPGADLSYGMFDSAQLGGADLRKTNLRNVWLREANLSGSRMEGVQFGELPYLQDSKVIICAYSPNGKTCAVGLSNGNISLYDTVNWSRIQTLKGHDAQVTGLKYSPQGGQIVSGSIDGTVRLWDVETGKCVHILQGHSNSAWRAGHIGHVTSVVYSPKGDQIASGSTNKIVRLWDVETGNCVHTLQGHSDWVRSVVYSPKGDQIASGSWDRTVRLWDVETGNCVHTLQGHSEKVLSVVYSPKGDQIASGSADKTVRLWDVETGNCVHTLHEHSRAVQSVVYSPKGGQIASGSTDKTVRLWDVETGNCVHILQGHSEEVSSVVYSPKGDQIASGSLDKTVRLWNVETNNYVHTLQGHSGHVTSIVYSPKGDQIAFGSWDKTVRLWDVETSNCVHTLQGHSNTVLSVVYSPKGGQIASGSADKTVRLWDVETGNCVHTLQGHSEEVSSIVYSSKGDQIASGSWDRTVRLWDVETGNCIHILQGHSWHVTNVVYSPKGDQIASGSINMAVRLRDAETGNCIHTSQGHSNSVLRAVYSPKRALIASESADKSVRLWDVETGNCVHILQGHSNSVLSVAYSPKGDQIASESADKTVRLWDAEAGNSIHTLQGHSNLVLRAFCSAKGSQIASGSTSKTVRLWDVETGNCVHTLQGHSHQVQIVVYSPKGDQIASGSTDKTVRLWDVETGNCVHTLQGHSEEVSSIVYSSKGDQIASGSWDRTVRLWSVETGECLLLIKGFYDGVGSISWKNTFDHQYIVTCSQDGSVRQWQVIKDGDGFKAMLCWSSSHGVLTVFGASLNDVQGLSTVNRRLLHQRGALNSSLV